MDAQPTLLDRLVAEGLLLPSGVDGIYGRSEVFEDVLERVAAVAGAWGSEAGVSPKPEVLRFPPAMPRQGLVQSGYLNGFPHLAGTVYSFCGDEAGHREMLRCIAVGEDWSGSQSATELSLTPASCYPVYPIVARRGVLPDAGMLIDVRSYCFRHEPSLDPARMQAFQIREFVRIGSSEQVVAARDEWLARGPALMARLQLPHEVDIANDPFFGRGGKVLKVSQRDQKLKFEMLIPVAHADRMTACMSFNYHGDHFAQLHGIRTPQGDLAHTGCVGFGLERLTLALLRHHGLDPAAWPSQVRGVLWADQ